MIITAFLSAALFAQANTAKLPFLSPMFGSHMVLQRDKPNTLWGWASPGSPVSVSIGDRHADVKAGADGKWLVRISPPPTGGPYAVSVDGEQHVKLDDVLVGDVWICSGQSNMEMGIGAVRNAADEVAAANHPDIRLYMVQRNPALAPAPTPVGTWSACSPGSVVQDGW